MHLVYKKVSSQRSFKRDAEIESAKNEQTATHKTCLGEGDFYAVQITGFL